MSSSKQLTGLEFYKTGVYVLENKFHYFNLVRDLFLEISAKDIIQTSISSDFETYSSTWKHVPVVWNYELQDCFLDSSLAVDLHSSLTSYFDAKIKTISFYNARPGLNLHLHRDMSGNLISGKLRIHIPVVTNDKCFYLFQSHSCAHYFHAWQGGAFALDTGYLHGVLNDSSFDRVHLMVELHVSPVVQRMLPPKDLNWYMHCINFLFILIPSVFFKRLRHAICSFNQA